MNIRRYKIGEEAEIWQLYFRTTRIINGQDYTKEQIRRWAPDQIEPNWSERLRQTNPFIAEHEGQIIGFAELEPNGHIDRFYCHHEWQRRGVGKLLFRAVEHEALRIKLPLLFTEVSLNARNFFLSRGFEVVEEERNVICGTVAPRFRMQKRLKIA